MSRCKLRTPWPIDFKLRTVIGIDSLTVCILFGEISIFHSRVMGKKVYTNIVWMLTTGVSCALGAAVYCVCHKPGPGFPMSHVLVFLCSARRWFFILFILVELFKLSFHSRRVLGAVYTEIICYIYLFNQCLLLLKVVNLISFIFPPYKKDLTKTRIIFPRMISDWNRLPQPP